MGKRTKLWLIIAASLILIGCIIFAGVMTVLKWDFRKLSTVKYETNEYIITEGFKNIAISANTANVQILPSENAECRVICYEHTKVKHATKVEGDTLIIESEDTRRWYDYIGIDFRTSAITVYLPKAEYGALTVKNSTGDVEIPGNYTFDSMDIVTSTGDVRNEASATGAVKIKASTGDIFTEDITAGTLNLTVSTGKVTIKGVACEGDVRVRVSTGDATLTDVTCNSLITTGNTGKVTMNNVVAKEKFNIKRSTGDVKMDGCDAAEIHVETDTGSVTGTLLSEKVYIVDTDTGNVTVPESVTGGKCKISTNTGNIKIKTP